MREARSRPVALRPAVALAVAVGWMLLVQLGCLLAWQADWCGRAIALVHWLLVGVLPPALALWQAQPGR